jgi:N-acetylglucosaminyldiphosphoundecaprenol N-acetyl-beta-D-mannosaminyltransferase
LHSCYLKTDADVVAREFDQLSRPVYGLLGIPIDAVASSKAISLIRIAAQHRRPFLISTPNVNFLILSQADGDFRESLSMSDLCLVDGAPIVLLAKLLGIPISGRVAGSDIFERLKNDTSGQSLNVFLFGGTDKAAAIVSDLLNRSGGLRCVGTLNPGFGTVEEMSNNRIFDAINGGNADFLAVFLSAEKEQKWLLRNHKLLATPVRCGLGGTINFHAGLVKRAPRGVRKLGLEWLWRIKEEPYLWRRYWNDGRKLSALCIINVIPLIIEDLRRRRAPSRTLTVQQHDETALILVKLSGDAVAANVQIAIAAFRDALISNKKIVVDLSDVLNIDHRFFGLLLMLRKVLREQGLALDFCGANNRIRRVFKLNGFVSLL